VGLNNLEFRAWDKKEKKYIDLIGFYIFENDINLWFLDNKGFPDYKHYPIDRIIIEQYIGLKDEKSIKLFEGDKILKWGKEIIIDNLYTAGYMINECTLLEGDFKIIGNIHEE
jgi:uncharacterized phage protein (TIGR01671 family)